MILSRFRPSGDSNALGGASSGQGPSSSEPTDKFPKVDDFLAKRDFVGALTLLEFLKSISNLSTPSLIPYCAFHLGDYKRALQEYKALLTSPQSGGGGGGDNGPNNPKTNKEFEDPRDIHLNVACCYFAMGHYKEAQEEVDEGTDCDLKLRLLFHLAYRIGDEDTVMDLHSKLDDNLENHLSLACIHYLRGDYQTSIEIYKKILLDKRLHSILPDTLFLDPGGHLLENLSDDMISLIRSRCENELPLIQLLMQNRDYLAINVYVALCYHRLEYYDVSQEVLAVYLQSHPDSAIALNLRACNTFRLYTGSAAEKELKPLLNLMQQQEEQTKYGTFSNAYDLIKHNLVVFRKGDGALQAFPRLLGVVPEARLNLIIYYLHQEDVSSAYNLIKDSDPKTLPEYIIFAIVNVLLSQTTGNREYMGIAQKYFNRVGSDESEQDAVFGRLCMASAYFLANEFDQCLMYLNSVKTHFHNDDTFNFNYAQALAMTNNFEEAEGILCGIQNEKIKNDFSYIQCVTKCMIMNKKPRIAWEVYERMDTNHESFLILQMIAHECYVMGQFYYAAKAFDTLEKFEPNQEHWEGKRGACIGVFQLIIAGHEPKESLSDIIGFLRNSSKQNVEQILNVMKKWARENRINL